MSMPTRLCQRLLAVACCSSPLLGSGQQVGSGLDTTPLPAATGKCGQYDARVFRDLTTARKFKLATAYFVNPELPPKSEVAPTYRIEAFEHNGKEDILWDGLKDGKFRLLIPTGSGQFVPFSTAQWNMQQDCGADVSAEELKFDNAFPVPNLKSKASFTGFLGALTDEQKSSLKVLGTRAREVDVKTSGEVVSWSPADTETLHYAPPGIKPR